MTAAGALLLVLAAWLGGRALLPSRERLPRSAWEEQALALSLGLAAWMVLPMAWTALGGRLSAPFAWTLAGFGLAAGILRLRSDRRRGRGLEAGVLPKGQLAAALALGAMAALLTVAFPLNAFDPILHFACKSKVLFHSGDILDPAFTAVLPPPDASDGFGRILTHPNYPLGIPFLEAQAALLGGAWSERWVKLPLAFWLLCLPGLVTAGLHGASPRVRRLALWVALAVPMFQVRAFLSSLEDTLARAGFSGLTILGGADLSLTVLYLGALALLLRARTAGCWRTAAGAGLLLAGGVLVKNEGLALLGVAGLALLTGAPLSPRRAWTASAVALGVGLLLASPWLFHRGRLPAIDENYGERLSWSSIVEHWNGPEKVEKSRSARLGEKDAEILREPPRRRDLVLRLYPLRMGSWLGLRNWGLLWLLVLLAIPAALRRREARWLAALVLGGHLLYFLVLLVTPWYLLSLTNTGIPERVWLHLAGPAVLLIGTVLGSVPEKLAPGGPAAPPGS